MKRRFLTLILTLLLLLSLSVAAFAASDSGLPLVTDSAGILTAEEDAALNSLAEELSERYACDIIVITVPDLQGWNVEEYTEAVYQQYGFGYGEEKSGVILLLSMSERDYDMAAYGYGNTAFTDYGKDVLMGSVLPYLGRDDWYGGFREFITLCGSYLESSRNGSPIDNYGGGYSSYEPAPAVTPGKAIGALIVGLIVAGIVSSGQKKKMKSAVMQTQANRYMNELNVVSREDRFLRTETHKVRRESSSGGSRGGGGGTSVRSSGFSHHSGKF